MAELDYVFSYLYENQDVGIPFALSRVMELCTGRLMRLGRFRLRLQAGLSTGTERL